MNEPSPSDDVDERLAELIDLYTERRRQGDRFPLSAFAAEHPDLADEIMELFPLVGCVEDAAEHRGHEFPTHLPKQIAGYHIIEELGRGGMGVVYRAMQQPLQRPVALKVLTRLSAYDNAARSRFQQEARISARLHHKNIVPVFDVGETDGVCYFAMQLIRGVQLSDLVLADLAESASNSNDDSRSHRKDRWRTFANLLAQAAEGLDYAHNQGVLHRDVKPSNLLVDDRWTVWISDFGLAKLVDEDLTNTGDMPGTLRYMSPERLQGECDERADIYGLGATAYEVCTGRKLVGGNDRLSITHGICHVEHVLARSVNPAIPADLEAIIHCCVDQDPRRRYQTAADLAADLRSFADGFAIQARRISKAEQIWRWSRKHRWVAATLMITFLSMSLGLVGLGQVARLQHQKRVTADLLRDQEMGLRKQADRFAQLATARARTSRENRYFAEMNLAGVIADTTFGIPRVRSLLKEWSPLSGSDATLIGWEWHFLHNLSNNTVSAPFEFEISDNEASMLAIAANSIAFVDKTRVRIQRDDGEFIAEFPVELPVAAMEWSRSGQKLAFATENGLVTVVSVAGKKLTEREFEVFALLSLAWRDAEELVVGHDAEVSIWNTRTGDSITRPAPRPVVRVRAGKSLVAEHPDGWITSWKKGSLEPRELNLGRYAGVAVSPTQDRIAVPRGTSVAIWDLETKEVANRIQAARQAITSVAWNPQGNAIAAGTSGGRIVLWSVQQSIDSLSQPLLRPHEIVADYQFEDRRIEALLFLDAERLLSWNLAPSMSKERRILTFAALRARRSLNVAISRSSRHVLSWQRGSRHVAVSDIQAGTLLIDTKTLASDVLSATPARATAASLRCRYVASTTSTRDIEVIDSQTRQLVEVPGPYSESLVFGGDAKLYVATMRGDVHAIDPETGVVLDKVQLDGGRVRSIAYCASRRLLAIGHQSGTVSFCSTEAGLTLERAFDVASGGLMCVRFGPKGEQFVVAHAQTAALWDYDTKSMIMEFKDHVAGVFGVDLHPSEPRLATCSVDQTVRVWDTRSGKQLISFTDHISPVSAVQWSPTGFDLASVGGNGHWIVRSAGPEHPQ